MIASLACRRTDRLWQRERAHGLPPQIERVALGKLVQLDRARSLEDLRVPPGNRLEPLRENRAGQHSIRVNDQWRLCFRWMADDAHEVELCDYH